MIKFKMNKLIGAISTLGLLLFSKAALAYDFAASTGLDTTAKKTGHYSQRLFGAGTTLEGGISAILTVALSFLGVIFLLLMIFGGILWMTARGNEKNVDRAKTIIFDSIIGLVIIIAAYAITFFVTSVFVNQTMQ
jgi:4-hydroxybenzoate polyprenyltransferase